MKKALLLVLGAITSYSSFAQVDTLYNTASGAQGDSVVSFPAAGGVGYLTGMNDGAALGSSTPSVADQTMGAAEAYNPSFNSTKVYKVVGIMSIWGGSLNTVGSEALTYHVWAVDSTHMNAYPTGIGNDSVAGFPGTSLTSTGATFADLQLNTGNINPLTVKRTFTSFSTAAEVSKPFFVGYMFDNTYTLGSPQDTVTVAETNKPVGITFYPGHDDYYVDYGSYKLYQSRNCVYRNSMWRDLYQDYGYTGFLALVPIVEVDNLGVGSITKGGLSFSGAYPNPSINNTNIKFSLAKNADVTVEIMDMSGRVLNTIQQKGLGNGEHSIAVSTANMAAGNYLYTVTTSNGDAIGSKLTVIK
jgi:hypothetical protein